METTRRLRSLPITGHKMSSSEHNVPPARPSSPSDATSADESTAARAGPADHDSASRQRQLWRSVFRHGREDTLANRVQAIVGNFFLHLHPARILRPALRFHFTLCAGGITFLLFLITVVTGALLMFHYRPSPLHAHGDMISLTQEVPFGALLRSLHRYAGDGMVIAVFVHLVRVLLTGSYKPPREFNWVLGVALLVLTLAIAFTGYLLPWDQKGYWATTVATHMLGATPILGADGPAAMVSADQDLRAGLLGSAAIGPTSLARFYTLHCIVLPLLIGLLSGWHFWRVRKDGISTPL